MPPSLPLRLLHVCPRPSFSGLEAYALAMAEGQAALGHDVTFVVLRGSPLAQKCTAAGLRTVALDPGLSGRFAFWREIGAWLSSARAPHIVHLHSTQDLELMLVPLSLARVRGLRPGRVRGARPRVILQTHIWISHSKRDPLHALSYRFVDEVWCSSGSARATLEKFLPVSPRKIRVVNYGRDVEKISAHFLSRPDARARLSLPGDAVVIGAVARIDKGKGTRELLDAAIEVMTTQPVLHLLWIGPPTADDPKAVAFGAEIESRLGALAPELRARIHFPGAIADSYRLLKALDLFALPTYKECFSLSLLEAQLAALPVLGTRAGGTPEVVRENQTGWLFEPDSVSSLVDAIQRALGERTRWSEFGAAAASRVRADFDFARLLPQTIDGYRELLARGPSRDVGV